MLVEALLVEKNGTTNETSFHLPSWNHELSYGISLQGNEFKIKGCRQITVNYQEK